MLVIRPAQMHQLEEAQLRSWLGAYLSKCYPRQIESWTTARLSSLVDAAILGGRARGLSDAADLRKYLHVTFLLGHHFESDPSSAWACRILDDVEQPDPAERVATLEKAIIERLRRPSPQL